MQPGHHTQVEDVESVLQALALDNISSNICITDKLISEVRKKPSGLQSMRNSNLTEGKAFVLLSRSSPSTLDDFKTELPAGEV